MLKLSSLFSSVVLGAAFDEVVSEHAAMGRVHPKFSAMLDVAYGIPLPTKSADAIKFLNGKLFASETRIKFAQGEGSMLGAVAVMQSLHAFALALVAGMSDKHAKPEVRPLPEWACPVAIEARKQRVREAKAAKAASTVSADTDADTAEAVSPVALSIPTARDSRERFLALRNELLAMLPHGVMTAAERDSLVTALQGAVTMAEPQAASAKAASKAKAASRKISPAPALVQ